jgi:hypothetical protein
MKINRFGGEPENTLPYNYISILRGEFERVRY